MGVENTNSSNNILEMDLDENSAKYLQESLDSWKESVMSQLLEEVETLKQSTIEELEEENIAYKQSLKEEYADKMVVALSEMREEIKAEVIAESIQNNPEIKVLEKIKELMAPVIAEDYRDNVYSDSISVLQAKIEKLEEEKNLNEGAKTLASLIAPLSETTQKIVLSLIKEGTSDEIEEQFYNILESLESVFGEAEKDEEKDDEDEEEDTDEEDVEDEDEDDDEDDDEEDDTEDDEDTEKKSKKDDVKSESYLDTGYTGLNEEAEKPRNKIRESIQKYAK